MYGGTDIRRQMKELQKGVHVVVATPGRLVDLLNRKALNIETVFAVVLDEADEMLNMGFQEDLDFILSNTPKDKNTYLFSATMPKRPALVRPVRPYGQGWQEVHHRGCPELSGEPEGDFRGEKESGCRHCVSPILYGSCERLLRDVTSNRGLRSQYVCYYFYSHEE